MSSSSDFSAPKLDEAPLQGISLVISPCSDFNITGRGDNIQWGKALWVNMKKLDKGGMDYMSRFKMLYSPKGVYVIFNGEDRKMASHFKNDFDKLFLGDVFEVFFHPDPAIPVYFEYEISPFNKELVLLMVNKNGIVSGWTPWPYNEDCRVKKMVHITEEGVEEEANIKTWTAELFFPYSLLGPFQNTPPEKGTRWNANFCRLDYDTGSMVKWAWAPVESSFHELNRYYSLRFE